MLCGVVVKCAHGICTGDSEGVELPSQVGHDGEYLTTNGTTASWSDATILGENVIGDISGDAANITGVAAIANGGTGQTTRSAALDALLPSQTGESGKSLKTNGTTHSWSKVVSITTVTKTDTWTATLGAARDWASVTDFTVTVNPTSGQKVVVTAFLSYCVNATGSTILSRFTDNGSVALEGDAAGSRFQVGSSGYCNAAGFMGTLTMTAVFSPTAGEHIYGVDLTTMSAVLIGLNRSATDTDTSSFMRGASTLTAMVVE